jgi:choline-sulfatase
MSNHPNVILLSIDALRPDHLGAYGAKQIQTPYIDDIARDGHVFLNAFGSSCLTPIAHASILSGLNPPGHGVRGPFDKVQAPLISETLKGEGYQTAAFTGVGFLGSKYGFGKGFDYFNEVTQETAWGSKDYLKDGRKQTCRFGNYWWGDMITWLKTNQQDPFFIFGHYFEVHWGAEKLLLEKGWLSPDHLPAFGHYDAKIEFMDKCLVAPLVNYLKASGIWDRTIIVITADHGENLGERPVTPQFYPQHRTLYECDHRIPLIIKAPGLEPGKRTRALARSIDIVPTLCDLLDIDDTGFEGTSLRKPILEREADGPIAYAEELYSLRGDGDWQAVRSEQYKYIIDRRSGKEEFFRMPSDPFEQNNLIGTLTHKEADLVHSWRLLCDQYLPKMGASNPKK